MLELWKVKAYVFKGKNEKTLQNSIDSNANEDTVKKASQYKNLLPQGVKED